MPGGGYDLDEIRRRADIVEIITPHVASGAPVAD